MHAKNKTKAISSSNFELLMEFYGDEIPGYVKYACKLFVVIHVGDEIFGIRDLKITIEDVIKYYAYEAENLLSGCRTIAGYTSDWRGIDLIANECLEWFKFVNAVRLKRTARKYGLTPKF